MTYAKLHNPNTDTIYQINVSGADIEKLVKAGCETSDVPFKDIPVEDVLHDQHPQSWSWDYGAGIDPEDFVRTERFIVQHGERLKLIETVYPRGGKVTTVEAAE